MTTEPPNDNSDKTNTLAEEWVYVSDDNTSHPALDLVQACWDDECEYADTHQSTRRQLLTGCTLLTGAIFLVLDSMMEHAASVKGGNLLYIAAVLGSLSLLFTFLTLYKLYTNRSVCRMYFLLIVWVILYKGAEKRRPNSVPRGRAARKIISGESIKEQLDDVSELLDMTADAAKEVRCMRILGAYHELQRKNDTIRERNEGATSLFLLSAFVGILGLAIYVVSIHKASFSVDRNTANTKNEMLESDKGQQL